MADELISGSVSSTAPQPPARPGPGIPPTGPMPPRYRHRSIFSGLVLILIGGLLLADRLHPGMDLWHVIVRFWPVLLILWGAAKLIERIGAPQGSPRVNGGEVAFVIVLLCMVGVVAVVTSVRDRVPFEGFDFGPFTQRYTKTTHADVASIRPDSAIAIDTRNGAINIHPNNGNGLKVTGTASAAGIDEGMAYDRIRNLDVVLDGSNGDYRIHPVN